MNHEIKRTDKFQYEMNVKVSESEFNTAFDKIIKKEAKILSVPGFRKGKTPPHIIRKMYGEFIKKDFAEDIINDLFVQIVIPNKILVLKSPQVLEFNFDDVNNIFFKVKYESTDPIEEVQYKDITIDNKKFIVTDKLVEDNITNSLISKSIKQDAEVIDGKFYEANIEIRKVDESGVVLLNEPSDTFDLKLYQEINPEFYMNLQNKKVNDEFIFTQTHTHDHDHEHETPEEHAAHEHKEHYKVKINRISKLVLPELTDELAKELSKNKYNTVQEYKNGVKETLQKNYDSFSTMMENDLIAREIVAKNNVDVPDSLVENYWERFLENEKMYNREIDLKNEELVNKIKAEKRPDLIFTAKWNLIKEKIFELENIEITDEDYEKEAENLIKSTGISKDKALQYIKKSAERATALKENKLYDILKKYITINNEVVELDK